MPRINAEEKREYNRMYRLKNKESIIQKKKQYYLDNIEKIKEGRKKYYTENKDRILEREKIRSLTNKDKKREYDKNYRTVNEKKVKAKKKEYYNKVKEVIKFKPSSLSSKFRLLIKNAKIRNLEVVITFDQYSRFIENSSCFYCERDIPLKGAGLDRLDNEKGYTLDNIAPCCSECNEIKGDRLTSNEMKVVAKALKLYREMKV